ncbi:MAG: response regulator [Deltaproteobacteria bacterium]|nr:response regulator [Deltaproteobacteria bacterium]
MPDLLILCPDTDLLLQLEPLGRQLSFRVKSTTEQQVAESWLELRKFDLALMHTSIPLPVQERLADLLWKRNLAARLLLVGFEPDDPRAPAARLFGAEVVRGQDLISELTQILQAFKPQPRVNEKQHHILVVEDLDSPRDIICILIESMGYVHVHGRGSAAEALATLEEEPQKYTCVITDIRMPEMNGVELIRKVRATQSMSHIPVVVLTAFGTSDWLIECLKAGASGFLIKPPRKDDLARELGRPTRIFSHGLDPRLVKEDDLEALQRILEERGFV